MLTNNQVLTSFIEPLQVHFPKMPEDAERFMADLTSELRRFSLETLDLARREIMKGRKYRTFPALGDCLDMCRRFDDAKPQQKAVGTMTPAAFQVAGLSWIRSRGRAEGITDKDVEEWACWKEYFRRMNNHGYLAMMASVEMGQQKGLTVPTRYPKEFDADAPTYAEIAARTVILDGHRKAA